MGHNGLVSEFAKNPTATRFRPALVNAGIYAVNHELIADPVSAEEDPTGATSFLLLLR